jgi:TM2 domain-containing membrane protein YozV
MEESFMSDVHTSMKYDALKRSIFVAYILWWFFGIFGGHRFYLGRSGSAIAMLLISLFSIPLMFVIIGFLTIWITGIWALVDAFLIPGMVRDANLQLVAALTPTAG